MRVVWACLQCTNAGRMFFDNDRWVRAVVAGAHSAAPCESDEPVEHKHVYSVRTTHRVSHARSLQSSPPEYTTSVDHWLNAVIHTSAPAPPKYSWADHCETHTHGIVSCKRHRFGRQHLHTRLTSCTSVAPASEVSKSDTMLWPRSNIAQRDDTRQGSDAIALFFQHTPYEPVRSTDSDAWSRSGVHTVAPVL